MQNKPNLSKYYSRAANFVKLTRFAVILVFIFFLLSCILVFRDDITLDNVQYLMKYADFYDSSLAADNAEISISADSESHMLTIRDNLAVVSRSGIGLYEFSGHKLFNYAFSYSSPAAVHDDRNILVYDIKGTGLSIFNSFSRIFTQEYPYGVKTACINPAGFAVVTGESSYRSVAIAYNGKYEEIFRWECADRYITSIDLSEDASKLLCSAVNSSDGVYDTQVVIYDTHSGKVLFEKSITDELALKVSFSKDDDSIFVLTDSMMYFLNSSLEEKSSYKYNQSKCEDFFVNDEMIVITESNNLSGNSMEIIGFDYSGNKLFSENADSKVTDVSIGKEHIFALSPQCVYVYSINENMSLSLKDKILTNTNYTYILSDSSERFVLANTKKAVRFSSDSEEKKGETSEDTDNR